MRISSPGLTVSGSPNFALVRFGVTLLELAAVVLLIGLVGAVAAARYGGSAIADVGAQGFARRLALDCLQARRRAISTGDNHLVRFTLNGGSATEYALFRRQGGSVVQVDDLRSTPAGVSVTTGGVVDIEFTFTGETLSACTVSVQAPDRTRTVTVYPVTGQAVVN